MKKASIRLRSKETVARLNCKDRVREIEAAVAQCVASHMDIPESWKSELQELEEYLRQNVINPTDTFDRFFVDEVAWPKDLLSNPFPLGTLYEPIWTDILHNLIPSVTVVRAWCINSYLGLNDQYTADLRVRSKEISNAWVSICTVLGPGPTKRQAAALLNEGGRVGKPRFDEDFQDDVMLLSKANDEDGKPTSIWAFFWFHRSGQSSLGRFVSDLSDGEVLEIFDTYVRDINGLNSPNSGDLPILITPEYLVGS